MKLLPTPTKINRILSIDPSSHAIAFAVVDGGKLVATGRIDFPKGCGTHERMKVISSSVPAILRIHKPDYVLIEESIWIQNPNTSRTLAYIVGGIWGQVAAENRLGGHVGPLKWKSGLGYKNVSKKEKDAWVEEMGEKEMKKKAAFERKDRVRQIVEARIPGLDEPDLDIMDAIAIGLWGSENLELLI